MADKIYEVLEGKKYTGKHGVYKEGRQFPESELFGDVESALKSTIKLVTKATKESKATK